MSSLRNVQGRVVAKVGAFKKDRSGFTAIEFAMVVIPFMMLVFGIINIGLFYFTTFSLENALERAARLVRTGQAQSGQQPMTAEDFKQAVCGRMPSFVDCSGKLRVDVRSFPSFSSIQGNEPPGLDGSGNLGTGFSFTPGSGGDVVLVTAFYEWDMTKLMPFISLGNMASGARLIQAATAFRNEPFN
ncbi:MAG: TadE/TadG family type IV pilus assembly protein [Hyphomicrobiaceae bacterium]